ncbi:MAG: GTPase [Candidatus Syntrophopropionicum ammoniitolerans]
MNLNCGLIGLPMVGKTTIFNLLTGADAETSNYLTGKTETNSRVAVVADPRVDFLSDLYKPRKTIHATILFSDVPGLVQGSSLGEGVGNQFLNSIRNVDLLVHIVRAFTNDQVPMWTVQSIPWGILKLSTPSFSWLIWRLLRSGSRELKAVKR